jgi:predicted PurR-regulated permease PerM
MESAITLFGFLILTFLGLIVPLLGILLSLFRQGIIELTAQYENQKTNSEKNLSEQLKRQGESGQPNVPEIQKSIQELTKIKEAADKKLSYLNPKKQLLRLFLFLFISFLSTIGALLLKDHTFYRVVSVILSLFFFCITIFILWKLLGILVEVKQTVDARRGELESKIIGLLSLSSSAGFIKDVYPMINGKAVENDKSEIEIALNTKNTLKLAIINSEKRMAKRVEMGLVFPREFIVEKSTGYSIYTSGDGSQIVRYQTTELQGKTNLILADLIINPIKKDTFKIRTFINAENIETVSYLVLFKIQ